MSVEASERHSTDGRDGHNPLWDLLDTFVPFYGARYIGVTIDIVFLWWEELAIYHLGYDAFYDSEYVDDTFREMYKNMVAVQKWSIAIGRVVTTELFIWLYWGQADWFTRQAVSNWEKGYRRQQF